MKKHILFFFMLVFSLSFYVLPAQAHSEIPEEILAIQESVKVETSGTPRAQAFTFGEAGPKVAILGDSLSTYKGYSLWKNYYYEESLMNLEDTWWGRYLNDIGGQLSAGETLGASSISWNGQNLASYYNENSYMASDYRIGRLAAGGTPDIIFFFGGTNDFYWRPEVGSFIPENNGMVDTFGNAYNTALAKMRMNYPQAQIICITPFRVREAPDPVLDQYCEMIHTAAAYYGAQVVDLRSAGLEAADCYDDVHPNKSGMNKIYGMVSAGAPPVKCEGIEATVANGILSASVTTSGTYTGAKEYQWEVINLKNQAVEFVSPWLPDEAFSWQLTKNGEFQVKVTVRDDHNTLSTVSTVITGDPEFVINGIYIPDVNRVTISAGVNVSPDYENKEFQWQYYDCQTGEWRIIKEWNDQTTWIDWTPPKSGTYWLHCQVRSTITGNIVSHTNGFHYTQPKEFVVNGIYIPSYQENSIQAGVNISPDYKDKEYRWQYYDVKEQTWHLLSDWQSTSNWATFTPPKDGAFWLHCEVRSLLSGQRESLIKPFNYARPPLTTNGIYIPSHSGNQLSAGINLSSYKDNEYRWLYYNIDNGSWYTIQEWQKTSNWITWSIPHKGAFLLYCEVRNSYNQSINYAAGIIYK